MTEWTEEQKRTIEERDRNILVSAAAGSGKTTVMVERIKQLILKDNEDIDGFLITTFTKAAASDMKRKLEKTIRNELKSRSVGDPERSFLLRQLYLLPSASISTFHSFAINIIKEYFYLTDLKPGFAIGDDVETAIMEKEAVDRVFEMHYEDREDKEFRQFLIRRSSDRNDNRLKDTIRETYKKIRSVPDYFEWADKMADRLDSDNVYEELGINGFLEEERDRAIAGAKGYFEKAADFVDGGVFPDIKQKLMGDIMILEGVADMDEEAFGEFVRKPGFATLRAGKDNKVKWDAIKEQVTGIRDKGKKFISDLKKKYYYDTPEVLAEELFAVKQDTMYFIRLMREFEKEYRERKMQKNILDFDDVMHYAIDILKDDKAAEELGKRYRYIFIDEYQDSNLLQEAIIGRISGPDNLFMVGDVKQSIYRFRLAEPEIFKKTAEAYRAKSSEKSTVIDLNNNFRSKKNVTDAVNAVFSNIMPGYGDEDALHCTRGASPYKTTLHIVDGDAAKINDIEPIEAEGKTAVEIIRRCLAEGFDYRDIAVLARNRSSVGELENLLINEEIPAYGEKNEGYFESVEIRVFINFLRVTDNMRQDVPLISVMRSVLYNFSFEEMARIRAEFPDGSFCGALRAYREDGADETIRSKIIKLISSLEYWRELSRTLNLEELIKRMLYDTGYYDYCSSLPVGKQRISNLRLIVEKAAVYEKTNHSGLQGFLRYIEAMKDSNLTVSEAKTLSENENVVRVMTIHKSKGLEFPVVIIVGAGRNAGRSKTEEIAMHKDFGLGIKLVYPDRRQKQDTILRNVISGKKKRDDFEEEIRILYVAMTRAEERLEIVGTASADNINDEQEAVSYIDMIYPALNKLDTGETVTYNDFEAITGKNYKRFPIKQLLEAAKNPPESNRGKAAAERLSFVYPHEKSDTKPKYSVSQLNRKNEIEEIPLAEFRPERRDGRLTAAERGNVIHKVMEHIDFAKAAAGGKAYVEAFADEMHMKGMLTERERESLDSDGIAGFFMQDPGRRAAEAFAQEKLRREQEFILRKEIEGTSSIVQGIIDCFYESDRGTVLIDYKNSSIYSEGEEEIKELYKGQIELYKEALDKAGTCSVNEAYIYLFKSKKFIDML